MLLHFPDAFFPCDERFSPRNSLFMVMQFGVSLPTNTWISRSYQHNLLIGNASSSIFRASTISGI